MSSRTVLVYHAPDEPGGPPALASVAAAHGLVLEGLPRIQDVLHTVERAYPAGVLLAADAEGAIDACRRIKADPFSAIIPVVAQVPPGRADLVLAALEAGADEVLTGDMEPREQELRLRMLLRRADRDVSVHPTTRLPGTPQIERDIADRIRSGQHFAVCYADLDHFKEFNDRYGYNHGDRVIRVLSLILRDVVKGLAPDGFVGHIGGDDFIFNLPLDLMPRCCEEIIEVFDELIPYQYNDEDRRAGYFLGRDRRGNILWVPLMTLSIGVVTNQHRQFTHTAKVSELATEMKSFAKKQPGSIYAVDRRSDQTTFYGRSITTSDELEPPTEP